MNDQSFTQAVGPMPGGTSLAGLDVTWGRTFKVWWALTWRSVLFGGLAGGLVGFVIGFVMGFAGAAREQITAATFWAGLIAAVPVGLAVVRHVLTRPWGEFRIALVPTTRAA